MGCEATLGLLGRPNAANAGINIGPTFIPNDGSKAAPMVNPEARTGVHLTPLTSSVYVQYVTCYSRLPFFTGLAGKLEPIMNIKPSYSQAGGISQSMSASTASSCDVAKVMIE